MHAPEHANQKHPGRRYDCAEEEKEPEAVQPRRSIPHGVAVEVGASGENPAPQLAVSIPLAGSVVVSNHLKLGVAPVFRHLCHNTTGRAL